MYNTPASTEIVMYTVKDIIKIFKCSQPQAYKIVNANGFPAIKIGGMLMVEHTALEKWLEKNRNKKIRL